MTVKKTDSTEATPVKEKEVVVDKKEVKPVVVKEKPVKTTLTATTKDLITKDLANVQTGDRSAQVVEGEEITWESRVVVEGTRMKPVLQGLVSADQISFVSQGVEVSISHDFRYAKQYRRPIQTEEDECFGPGSTYIPPSVDVYVLRENEKRLVLFLDAKSSVTFNERRDIFTWRRDQGNGCVLLINSVSRDDTFVGENSLINMDTSDCLFNRSSAQATKTRQGRRQPWERVGSPFVADTPRHRLFDVRLKDCTVTDSVVGEGDYIGSRISRSEIKNGYKKAKISESNINNSSLEAPRISIRNTPLFGCTIRSESELVMHNFSQHLKDVNWNFSGVFLKNRFGYLSIDLVAQRSSSFELIRCSDKEVELSFAGRSEKLEITSTDQFRLDQVIRKLLGIEETHQPFRFNAYNTEGRSESIEGSIARYVGNTVRSRLEMIELLDQVVRNARLVEQTRRPFEDMYKLS